MDIGKPLEPNFLNRRLLDLFAIDHLTDQVFEEEIKEKLRKVGSHRVGDLIGEELENILRGNRT